MPERLQFGYPSSKADAIAEAKRQKQFESHVQACIAVARYTTRQYRVRKWWLAVVEEAERRMGGAK